MKELWQTILDPGARHRVHHIILFLNTSEIFHIEFLSVLLRFKADPYLLSLHFTVAQEAVCSRPGPAFLVSLCTTCPVIHPSPSCQTPFGSWNSHAHSHLRTLRLAASFS